MRLKPGFCLLMISISATAHADRPYVVVIDPGHGGHDPGAISPNKGATEKSTTLAIALAVRNALHKKRNIRIVLTHSSDWFVTLVARRRIAEANHADLFLSIHADSSRDQSIRGASIYTLREDGRPLVVRRIASGSNVGGVAISSLGHDVADVLGDLEERAAMNDSAYFAVRLAAALGHVTAMRGQPRLSARFAVLKAKGIPAVLLEAGYITNSDDAAVLTTIQGQKRIAKAIAAAIEIAAKISNKK